MPNISSASTIENLKKFSAVGAIPTHISREPVLARVESFFGGCHDVCRASLYG